MPPTYYDIQTDVTFTGKARVCLSYAGTNYRDESKLRLLHYNEEAGRWEDITLAGYPDVEKDLICGETTSFYPFAAAEVDEAPVITAPDVTAVAPSAAGAAVSSAVAPAADDFERRVEVSCDRPSGSQFPLGKTSVKCTATDSGGSTAEKGFTVTVTYDWSNFLQPINLDGTSAYKLGRIIPVKFRPTGASAGVTNAEATFYRRRVADAAGAQVTETATAAAATGGTIFRHDAASGQYIYNWSTQG